MTEARPTSGRARVKSATIVGDGKEQTTIAQCKRQLNATGFGMARNIAQSLLSDPIDTQCSIFGDSLGKSVRRDVNLYRLDTCDALALGFQRLDEAEIVEYRRMQPVRKVVHVLA